MSIRGLARSPVEPESRNSHNFVIHKSGTTVTSFAGFALAAVVPAVIIGVLPWSTGSFTNIPKAGDSLRRWAKYLNPSSVTSMRPVTQAADGVMPRMKVASVRSNSLGYWTSCRTTRTIPIGLT